jgi:hypothetical protein
MELAGQNAAGDERTDGGFKNECLPSNAPLLVLRIYGTGGKKPWGLLTNAYVKSPVPCSDLGDAMIKADGIYDELDYPEAYFCRRSFFIKPEPRRRENADAAEPGRLGPRKKYRSLAACTIHESCAATFIIETVFRRNASWQGRVIWQEKKRTCYYRSALELMRIIDEAVRSAESPDGETQGSGTSGCGRVRAC